MAQITSDETEFIHIIGSMELAMANVEDEQATEEDIQRFQEEDESGDKAFSDKDEEHEYEECAADGAADIIKSTKHMTAPSPSRKALRPLFLQMRNFLS
ncbi:tRNA-cytidine(32) 2-sulfurtransferase [Trichinella pseudospiralis]